MADDKDTKEQQLHNTQNEVALELMKFIAVTTGYGKGTSGTGYGSKAGRTPEEYADSLLGLYERCREVVIKK
jgi:hypothetical protein